MGTSHINRDNNACDFASLGLSKELVAAVSNLGYEEPTPIQREAIPVLLEGRDLIGQAETGTGKTAAFALPMLQRVAKDPKGKEHPRGFILVPTRELAMQVAEAVHKYAKGSGLTVVPVYGGAPMDQQINALKRGADIVVATPGRALDHLRRRILALGALRVLVIDEADEMLNMGFAEDLEAILNATPKTRQTALFSATMPSPILAIAKRHLRDPTAVTIAREKAAAGKLPRIRQIAYVVTHAQKPAALARALETENPSSAIVFCRTRLEVDSITDTLAAHGHRAEALHGGFAQRQRDKVMKLFRAGKVDLLVATDVAARGLDIERVSHVINYNTPCAPEAYVHRIGRTGRLGRAGVAITLVEPREHRLLRNIEGLTKQKIEIATLPTVAEVRARRLELTQAALRERLLEGNLDDVRGVVESLGNEFDILDIAAAAVKMAHTAVLSGDNIREIPSLVETKRAKPRRGGRPGVVAERPRDGSRRRDFDKRSSGTLTRIYIGAGRQTGIRPGDVVGAIAGEAGIDSRVLGAVEIADRFSLVEVPEQLATTIIKALRATNIRGQKVSVRREHDKRTSPPKAFGGRNSGARADKPRKKPAFSFRYQG
jgi:ATP-dependent RNA helicase DeaD